MAAITNFQKLGNSKQQKFILSRFWRTEVWMEVLAGPHYLWRLWRRLLLCLFQLLGAARISGGHGTPVSAPAVTLLPFFVVSLCFPLTRTLVIGFRAHSKWDLDDLISRSLITSAKTLFPNKVTSQVPGICSRYLLGGHFLDYHISKVYVEGVSNIFKSTQPTYYYYFYFEKSDSVLYMAVCGLVFNLSNPAVLPSK